MDALQLLQFLTQHRNYLIAFAILAPIVFFLRVLGAAPDMPIAVFFTIYLAGAFCALLLLLQLIAYLNELGFRAPRQGKSLKSDAASTSDPRLHQIPRQPQVRGRELRDAPRADTPPALSPAAIPTRHLTKSRTQPSVPMLVWRAINDPEWNGGPTPDGPPWTSE